MWETAVLYERKKRKSLLSDKTELRFLFFGKWAQIHDQGLQGKLCSTNSNDFYKREIEDRNRHPFLTTTRGLSKTIRLHHELSGGKIGEPGIQIHKAMDLVEQWSRSCN